MELEIQRETEIQRKMETTVTTEMEMIGLNKTIANYKQETEIKRETETSLRQQTHEYKTSGIAYYLLSVQFISQNESIISMI